jgi:hypothetical protein
MSRSNRHPKLSRGWEEATPILRALGGRVHILFERLKSGKSVDKLRLLRGIETGNRSSLIQDLRRRAVIVTFDRNTSAYRLEQVGGIRIEQEPR